MAMRCCDTALELCSYRYQPAMLAAMASLCNGAAVNWWVSPFTIGSKSDLRRFPSILISVYLVITPHLRTVTLAWSDPLRSYVCQSENECAVTFFLMNGVGIGVCVFNDLIGAAF